MRGIKGFIETSLIDWPGMVSAVIFISNCNMRCGYCHNKDLILDRNLRDIQYVDIIKKLNTIRKWVDGVVISGGEATLNKDLITILKSLKEKGFKTKLDTNGSRPDVLKDLIGLGILDCVAMDVKAPLEEGLYKKVTGGYIDLEKIKNSINIILKGEIEYHIRVTLSPVLKLDEYKKLIISLEGVKKVILQKFKPGDILDESVNNLRNFNDEEIRDLALFSRKYIGEINISNR